VFVVVPPTTVAVRVVDCPTMITTVPPPPKEEVTLTVTAFVALLLLPQPPSQRPAIATASATQFQMLLDFITLASRR
jgi:hypothetical protein